MAFYKKKIANITSIVLNPYFVCLSILIIISVESTTNIGASIKWSLVLIALTILPVFIFTLYLVRNSRLDDISASVRRQRTRIYALAGISAGVSCIILFTLKAPLMLLSLSVAGFAGTVVFMCINLWRKISLHTACIAALVTILFILYGSISAASIILIPLVAWSRIELGHHSLMQIIMGALLGTSILLAVFYSFGLV